MTIKNVFFFVFFLVILAFERTRIFYKQQFLIIISKLLEIHVIFKRILSFKLSAIK